MAFAIDNDDLNGECFIVGNEGEPEIDVERNHVLFPDGYPSQTELNWAQPLAIAPAADQSLLFIKANCYALTRAQVPFRDALAIAYLRMIGARLGLISPQYDPITHHVKYNDAKQLTANETNVLVNGLTAGHADAYPDENAFNTAWNAGRNVIRKDILRLRFTDIVCCVAYMFRVRGHHYRPDFQGKYLNLWKRCLHDENDLPVSWEHLATTACHAILPDALDHYWGVSVNNSLCAGALVKRYDSAPAGSAGVHALKRGLDDVQMIFPGIADRVPEAKDQFNVLYNRVQADRWSASINSRYYGVQRVHVNEASIGALASVVLGVYEQLAPGSPLRDSPALQRLAQIAPATGGAIGRAALRTTQSDNFTLSPSANT